jgi:hypothetical protein
MLGGNLSPEEKTYDLEKVLKAFASMSLAYKHKSRVEDHIRIANNIINEADAIVSTPEGKQKVTKEGEKVQAKESLERLSKMMEYATDSFYGKSKDTQGVTKKELYTSEERRKLREYNTSKAKQEIEDKHDAGDISNEEYTEALESLQKEFGVYEVGRNLTWSRVGDSVIKYVQLKGMGWNVFSATTNMIYGFMSNVIHANGREDFSLGDLGKAFTIMLNSTGNAMTLGYASTENADKVRNLMVKLDVLKEFNEEAHKKRENSNKNKKGWQKLAPYELQRNSEYFIQGQQMVAMMLSTKLDPEDANSPSLWEAYGTDGNLKPEYASHTEWEGEAGNPEHNKKRHALKNRLDQVLKMTHGNYDPDSRVMAKKTILGRFLMQFRSWIGEGFATRFAGESPDMHLGRKTKGRYTTMKDLGFSATIATLAKQMMYKEDAFVNNGKKMDDVDIANMRKNLAEMGFLVSLMGLALVLKQMDLDDDDEEMKFAVTMMLNQVYRLENDIGFFVNPNSFEAITKSAMPVFSVVRDVANLGDAVGHLLMGEDEITRGKNAGESRTARALGKVIPGPTAYYKIKTTGEYLFE